jgi:hypothetical protein
MKADLKVGLDIYNLQPPTANSQEESLRAFFWKLELGR